MKAETRQELLYEALSRQNRADPMRFVRHVREGKPVLMNGGIVDCELL